MADSKTQHVESEKPDKFDHCSFMDSRSSENKLETNANSNQCDSPVSYDKDIEDNKQRSLNHKQINGSSSPPLLYSGLPDIENHQTTLINTTQIKTPPQKSVNDE